MSKYPKSILLIWIWLFSNPIFLQEIEEQNQDKVLSAQEVIQNVKNDNAEATNLNDVQVIDFIYEELIKNDTSMYYNIAYWYLELKEYDKSLAVYKVLENNNKDLSLGAAAYNMACIYSIKIDLNKSTYYIEKAFQSNYGLYDDEYNWLFQDPDLINLRASKGFKDLTDFYFSKKDLKVVALWRKTVDKNEKSDNKRSKRQAKKLAKTFIKIVEKERKTNFVSNVLVELAISSAARLYSEAGDERNYLKYSKQLVNTSLNEDGVIYSLIAYGYTDLGEYETALTYIDSVIDINNKNGNYKDEASGYRQAAYIYYNQLDEVNKAAMYMETSYYIDPSSIDIEDTKTFGWIDNIYALKVQENDVDGLFTFTKFLKKIGTERKNSLFNLRVDYTEGMLMSVSDRIYSETKLYKVIEQFENFPTLDEQIILDAYEGLISVLGMNFDNIEKVYKIIDKGVERSKDEEKHFFYHHQFRFKKYQRLEDWNKVKFHTKKIIDELSSDKNTFYIDKINLQEARLVYALAHFALEEYDETVEIAKDIYEELKNSPDPTAETALALIGNVGLKTDNEKLWESAIEELNLYVDRTYTNPSIISRELNDRILIYFELAAIVKFENHEPNRALERLERGKYRYLKTVLNKDAGVASYPEKTDEDEMFIGIEQVNSINSPMYNREDMSSYNKFNFNNLLSYQLIADNISMNLHYFNPDGYYFRLYNMESYLDSVNSSIVSLAYNKQNNHLNKSLVLEFLFNSLDIDIDSKPKITFIVDPIFQLTPFEALVDTNGNYLIENTEISYTFSSTIHSILQKRRYSKSEHKVLAIINPDYINPKKSKSLIGLVDASLLREDISRYNIADIHRSFGYTDWQKLPGAEKEGINIKAVMNTDILQKADATEDKLFELSANGGLKKYSIIHFATHALSLPELPEASSIILSKNNAEKFDGYLTPKEISRLDLQADFVNLSACETAVGKTYASEGIIGFAQAFIEAGANGVLVSLWNVNDQSTAVFMTSFYSHLSKQNTVSKALALTKREFINGDYGDEYRKPFYWAPYIYYGI